MVEKIKSLAKSKGKTLMDIEKECKIGQRSIYKWDEHMPSVDKAKRIADYFGITVEELMEE